ncbi:hypothetical protein BKA70DRAFT_1295842 [Coprinopsis sp. MPI-PUGE-AT-0042]|nr:hypothetical protein BKA70DRAFT_1295842 [Coprinopsis sp. MPI-PUGE-AT-0042]
MAIASQRKFRDPYYHAFSAASRAGFTAIPFPSLRECIFQCPEDDTSTATLRKFSFPTLEKFESQPHGRHYPRLESIFRDPRLFHLTHLTLSQYTFAKDHLRAEAVFGYMPVLTSLTVDSCLGVCFPPPRFGREDGELSCPRLESLSLWGCDDLEFRVLLRIVRARRGDKDGALRMAMKGWSRGGHCYMTNWER